MKRAFLSFFLAPFIFISCSNELDVTADWKDIPVVYGLLDSTQNIQYIQIFKGFLGDGDATDFAKNIDSIYYPEEDIEVKIKVGNTETILQREEIADKQTGIFATTPNYVYPLKTPIEAKKDYEFILTNKRTGKITNATTPIVTDLKIIRPRVSSPVSFVSNRPFEVNWTAALNGKVYELTIRFHYEEWLDSTPTEINTLSTDWFIFGREVAENFSENNREQMSFKIAGASFFSFLNNALEENPHIRRKALSAPLEFRFSAGGEDLFSFINASLSQNGITQFQANSPYTNISDGLGIFSSRYLKIRENIMLSNQTIDTLSCGAVTQNLNFVNSSCN